MAIFAAITVKTADYNGFTNGGVFNDPNLSGTSYKTWLQGNNLVNFTINANPIGASPETLFNKLRVYFSPAAGN